MSWDALNYPMAFVGKTLIELFEFVLNEAGERVVVPYDPLRPDKIGDWGYDYYYDDSSTDRDIIVKYDNSTNECPLCGKRRCSDGWKSY